MICFFIGVVLGAFLMRYLVIERIRKIFEGINLKKKENEENTEVA